MAKIECPDCGFFSRVRSELVGQKARCPKCDGFVEITAGRERSEATESGPSADEQGDGSDGVGFEVTRFRGGKVAYKIPGVAWMNKLSSLQWQYAVLNSAECPSQLVGAAGLIYHGQDREPCLQGSFKISHSAPTTAFEVAFMGIDVFGSFGEWRSSFVVRDMKAGVAESFTETWRLGFGYEASALCGSAAVIAAVRTETGDVFRQDLDAARAEVSSLQW